MTTITATIMPEMFTQPWEGIGTDVGNITSIADKLKAAGLDWKVEARPMYFKGHDDGGYESGQHEVSTHQVLVRADTDAQLSVVTADWRSLQNDDAFGAFDAFCQDAGYSIEVMGSLDDNKITWALASVPKTITINGDDVFFYVLFTNPHEYGKSVSMRLLALNNNLNSTMNFPIKLKLGRKRIDFDKAVVKQDIANQITFYESAAKLLADAKADLKSPEVIHYLKKLFPNESVGKKNELSRPAQGIASMAAKGGDSWWDLFSVLCHHTDHVLGHNQESRLKAAWYGFNRDRKVKALDMALALADTDA